MGERLRCVYVPMTETGSCILFSSQEERHGYYVTQRVKKITDSEIIISAGTLYGTLSKMEKDQLIRFTREEEKREYYQITELGSTVLQLELVRIDRLYIDSRGGYYHGNKEDLQVFLTCGI